MAPFLFQLNCALVHKARSIKTWSIVRVWCRGTWVAFTEPWPQPYLTPLIWTGMLIACQVFSYLTSQIIFLAKWAHIPTDTLQYFVVSLTRRTGESVTPYRYPWFWDWILQQGHIGVMVRSPDSFWPYSVFKKKKKWNACDRFYLGSGHS